MERPKPFNTWELADFTEDAVQLFEARVVNLKTALAILLVLDSNFGAKPSAQVRHFGFSAANLRLGCRSNTTRTYPCTG